VDPEQLTGTPILNEPTEQNLGLTLVRFNEVLDQVAREGYPHFLCSYLYELATRFMQFYESCPVLGDDTDIRHSRLLLAAKTADTMEQGLGLLGIQTVERM
jgi:arginyl-tRNA synthetase